MHRYIWLVPLLPLIGAAINGLFGRKFHFSEKLIGGIAVGSVALSFLISLVAIYSYGFSSQAIWPNAYVTTQGNFTWIPGGAVEITQGSKAREEISIKEESGRAASPEQQKEPRRPSIAGAVTPRSSVLNVEWGYKLD